jgi:ribonucleoside-diphosphate reductase subunit M1
LTKTDGTEEKINLETLKNNLTELSKNLSSKVDMELIMSKVTSGFSAKMTQNEMTDLISETIAYMNMLHPDYSLLAARVLAQELHGNTFDKIEDYAQLLYSFEGKSGRKHSLLAEETFRVMVEKKDFLNDMIDYSRDMQYDFFGFRTLTRSYLLKVRGEIKERPQQMLVRVAIGIHGDDMEKVKETYDLMSQKWFTHATPTLFNAGTRKPQMSSCFLLAMSEDSIDGIYDTLKRCALISKCAGGIGLSVTCIRAKGSYIAGTNGISNGLVPMLRVYNTTARYVDQGGGKRKGSFAMYLEPWHADIFEFLHLKKNHGKEEYRARDLFYAMWTPDLFMKRVQQDGDWTLMCPKECPGLGDSWGEEFEKLYEDYEKQGKGRKTIKARKLWNEIVQSQIETGTPYMVYKDACNRKSNQQNLGTIKSSNLCTEIVEYTSADEVAVCNLASIALPKFIKSNKEFDYEKLISVMRVATRNLNKVIDKNYYPVIEAKRSNLRHRPMGIGVQGFADVCAILKINFDSKEAQELNAKIFETMYYAAITQSIELAKEEGPYETFKGSPASKGIFQFDMWNVKASMYDWDTVKKDMMKHGLRNSLFLAPMPTASTSQILGNNETFEPFTANVYSRRVLSGEFICINKHLVKDLVKLNLWTEDLRQQILARNGSVQGIKQIPAEIQKLYRTVWELPQKSIIDLAVGRGPFICQSQSLNIFMESPELNKISSMHFYGWKKGLKTGMYYLRSRPAVDAIKFTVDYEKLKASDKDVLSEKKDAGNLLGKRTQDGPETKKENLTGVKRVKKKLPRMTLEQFNEEDMCLNCGS